MTIADTEGPETIILPGRMLTTVKSEQNNSQVIVCDRLNIKFWAAGVILEITIESRGMRWREYHRRWDEIRYPKQKIEKPPV